MKTIRHSSLLLAAVALAVAASAASNLIPNAALRAGADGRPAEWGTWAPRPGLAPAVALVTRDGTPALSLQAKDYADYGRWVSLVRGIEPGKYYHLEAWHQASAVETESVSVVAFLCWCRNANGTDELQRDYVLPDVTASGWRRHARTVRAPDGAQAVRVEFGLRWTKQGSVLWKDVALTEVPAPAPRVVRVATTRIMPGSVRTVEKNEELMTAMFDRIAEQKPDIVLFSENFSTRATRLALEKKAEPIPGPLTDLLGERARKYHCYVITTLHERDGDRYYNTAVLIDRAGQVVGRYRKVHLAIEEGEVGLTPGSDYPVFETDFGRIGILTCWDDWFSEPARILRLRGAEMLFYPLAGDGDDEHWDVVSRARAMDNGLYFVSSGTVSDASRIINPAGQVLAEARGDFAYAVKDLDLNQEWRLRYLSVGSGTGEAKTLYVAERRPDTYSDLTSGGPTPATPAGAGAPPKAAAGEGR